MLRTKKRPFDGSTQNFVILFLFCFVVLFIASSTVGENPEEPNHVWLLSGAWCVGHKWSFPPGKYQYWVLTVSSIVLKKVLAWNGSIIYVDKVRLVLPVEKRPTNVSSNEERVGQAKPDFTNKVHHNCEVTW